MDRRRLLVWLAIFAPAITFGGWVALRPTPRQPVDPRSVRVTVAVDGAFRIEGTDGTDLALGSVAEDAAGAEATLQRLQTELRRLRSGAPVDPTGSSLLTLDIHGPRVAPMRWILPILRVAIGPDISIHEIQFRLREDAREPVRTSMTRIGRNVPGPWKGGCEVTFRLVRPKASGATPPPTALLVELREQGLLYGRPLSPDPVIATIESGPTGLSSWLSEHSIEVSNCEVSFGFEGATTRKPSSAEEIPFGDLVDLLNVLSTYGHHPLRWG